MVTDSQNRQTNQNKKNQIIHNMENKARQSYRVAVMLIAAIILLPWGSRTHYNTKGEPREAIVAVSMLESGNWILPESHGHDIPYTPPMLAWCIASISKITRI